MKHKFISLLVACVAWLFASTSQTSAQANPSKCVSKITERLEALGQTAEFDFLKAREIMKKFDFGTVQAAVSDPAKAAAFKRVFTSLSEFCDLCGTSLSGKGMKGYTRFSGCVIRANGSDFVDHPRDAFTRNSGFKGKEFDDVMTQLGDDTRFALDAPNRTFTSNRSGLVYEPMNFNEGHRISHIIKGHIENDWSVSQGKSLFERPDEVFDVIDDGWMSAQKFQPDPVGNPNRWEVDLHPRIIGTSNETKLRIIVDQQTKVITTAFPIP